MYVCNGEFFFACVMLTCGFRTGFVGVRRNKQEEEEEEEETAAVWIETAVRKLAMLSRQEVSG